MNNSGFEMNKADNKYQIATPAQITITSNNGTQTGEVRTELAVTSMPEIKVDSPFDWAAAVSFVVSIFAFMLTAYIVKKTAEQQMQSYQDSVDAQKNIAAEERQLIKKQAEAEILTQSRQEWINTLRDTVAEFIASTLKISDLHSFKHGTDPANNTLQESEAIKNNLEWCLRLHEAKSVACALRNKIHLLANPNEPAFVELLTLVDDFYAKADEGGMGLHADTSEVIRLSQKILKVEWDRVKKLEGFA